MRRILAGVLLLGILVLPVQAAEPKKYVALTFDDGPSGVYTERLLDGLAIRGAKCTFLLCGYRIQQYPELTQRIFSEGHEIGYHGYTHDAMNAMSRRAIAGELMESQSLLPEDCDPVFFRPPGGLVSDAVRQVAQARQLALLSWSVDPKDWAIKDTGSIVSAVMSRVRDGDIVLLHDMKNSSVYAALKIIDLLQEKGFRFVTVSELARIRKTRITSGQVYNRFLPPKEEEMK